MKKIISLIISSAALCAALVNTADQYFSEADTYQPTILVRVNYQARQAVINCGSPDLSKTGKMQYGPVDCYKVDFSIPDGMFPSRKEVTAKYLHARYAHKFNYHYK